MLYDNIKLLCAKKRISIGSIEKALKFSNGSICKWNESEPGIRKVQKVADYLGVPIEKLLENELAGERRVTSSAKSKTD